ncbi:hypothetical protein K488DRAFT_70605 [Vararia minispora EC-137]|uniref:Uncharacterized protein n=1 Tax=Vararia minispora EC-137 TaxID=1314806 RepID=A0ACB8QL99_9AGAM|nr:hypothetical protein K488DRAFT_70605 [Vararia minispora EC-137]
MSNPVPPPDATNIEELWKEAFNVYEKIVGHKFPESPLADKLHSYTTVEDVYKALEEREGKFQAFRDKGKKIRNFLAPFVHAVRLFIDTGAEAASSLGVSGGKAPFVAFGVLLAAAKGVSDAYDGLEALMAKLGPFLERVKVHLDVPTTSNVNGLTVVLVKVFAELLRIFALVTKYLQDCDKIGNHHIIPRRVKHFAKQLVGEKDVADALTRLDELTKAELEMAVAEARRAAHRTEVYAERAATGAERVDKRLEEVLQTQEKIQQLQVDSQIAEWLSAPDPFVNHNRLSELRKSKQTVDWFFDDKFKNWERSENGVYWMYGKPRLSLMLFVRTRN